MRVGVLTFHHVANYGAVLQVVALQRVLHRLGHRVEVIDYRPASARRYYRRRWYPLRRRGQTVNRRSPQQGVKALRFERFLRQMLPLTSARKALSPTLTASSFDAVIVGSDQVWDVDSTIRGFDRAYFLDFVPDGVTRIAYAASFGATSDVGDRHREMSDLLARFDTVAVRDANSAALVEGLGRVDAVQVADPTCLEPLWDLAAAPRQSRPYLMLYAEQQLEPDEATAVRRIADERGLEVISIGFSHPVADRRLLAVGPREWLGWMQNADYVATSMFHGTIFAVLAGHPLSVFMRPGRYNKLGDLLTSLDLWDRVGPTADGHAWNPAAPRLRMADMAARSEAILSESLKHTIQTRQV